MPNRIRQFLPELSVADGGGGGRREAEREVLRATAIAGRILVLQICRL